MPMVCGLASTAAWGGDAGQCSTHLQTGHARGQWGEDRLPSRQPRQTRWPQPGRR